MHSFKMHNGESLGELAMKADTNLTGVFDYNIGTIVAASAFSTAEQWFPRVRVLPFDSSNAAFEFQDFQAVPEPSTYALLVLARTRRSGRLAAALPLKKTIAPANRGQRPTLPESRSWQASHHHRKLRPLGQPRGQHLRKHTGGAFSRPLTNSATGRIKPPAPSPPGARTPLACASARRPLYISPTITTARFCTEFCKLRPRNPTPCKSSTPPAGRCPTMSMDGSPPRHPPTSTYAPRQCSRGISRPPRGDSPGKTACGPTTREADVSWPTGSRRAAVRFWSCCTNHCPGPRAPTATASPHSKSGGRNWPPRKKCKLAFCTPMRRRTTVEAFSRPSSGPCGAARSPTSPASSDMQAARIIMLLREAGLRDPGISPSAVSTTPCTAAFASRPSAPSIFTPSIWPRKPWRTLWTSPKPESASTCPSPLGSSARAPGAAS